MLFKVVDTLLLKYKRAFRAHQYIKGPSFAHLQGVVLGSHEIEMTLRLAGTLIVKDYFFQHNSEYAIFSHFVFLIFQNL